MPLAPGTRLDPYTIVSLIGSGGMGEVYRVHDERLRRTVALKVLRPDLLARGDARPRLFEEARAASSLNHPNIVTVHDVGCAGGLDYIVMELVAGQTLARRLEDGAVALGEAVRWGIDIAAALAVAHAHGVVHRDLKPANVILTDDGRVKVVDFGIARRLHPRDEEGEATSTLDAMTDEPMIRGTAPYMSPEQITGAPADARSDIFALGAILYEMVSGQRAFHGATAVSTMAAVLECNPRPIREVAPGVTRALERIVERCLQKSQTSRYQTAIDLRFALEAIHEDLGSSDTGALGPAQVELSAANRSRRVRRRIAATVLGVGALAVAAWVLPGPALESNQQPLNLLSITTPQLAGIDIAEGDRVLAIIPDASGVVFAGNDGTQLFVREHGDRSPRELTPPSGGVRAPFVSPNSEWVGYVDLNFTLKRVPLSGGSSSSLATLDGPSRGATWAPDGAIIFGTSNSKTGLQRLAAGSSRPMVLTWPEASDGELDHVFPEMLPGGRAVLMTILPTSGRLEDAQIAVVEIASGTVTPLFRGGYNARYLASGHLVFVASGGLHAIAFDLDRMETYGTSLPVLDDVPTLAGGYGVAHFDVSANGTLAYLNAERATAGRTLIWRDRTTGAETPVEGLPPRPYAVPRLSPNGTLVIYIRDRQRDLWQFDLHGRPERPVTFGPDIDSWPVWVSDDYLVFGSMRNGGAAQVYMQSADGTGNPVQLTQGPTIFVPLSSAPDGSGVVVAEPPTPEDADGWNLRLLPLTGGRPTPQRIAPRNLEGVNSPYNERNGTISPTGQWLAYDSDRTGRFEVYVVPYPDTGTGGWQVSFTGGQQPAWGPNGELFYIGPIRTMIVATVDVRAREFKVDKTTPLFSGDFVVSSAGNVVRHYDVSPDGQQFLMLKDAANLPNVTNEIVVVQDWAAEVRRRFTR